MSAKALPVSAWTRCGGPIGPRQLLAKVREYLSSGRADEVIALHMSAHGTTERSRRGHWTSAHVGKADMRAESADFG